MQRGVSALGEGSLKPPVLSEWGQVGGVGWGQLLPCLALLEMEGGCQLHTAPQPAQMGLPCPV